MRATILMAVLLALSAARPSLADDKSQTAPKADTGPLPAPVPFEKWRGPFFAKTVKAAVVVIAQTPRPTNKDSFRAYGIDARSKKIVFQLSGAHAQLHGLNTALANEVSRRAGGQSHPGDNFTWGGTGQVIKPIGPQPGPGGDELRARLLLDFADIWLRASEKLGAGATTGTTGAQ